MFLDFLISRIQSTNPSFPPSAGAVPGVAAPPGLPAAVRPFAGGADGRPRLPPPLHAGPVRAPPAAAEGGQPGSLLPAQAEVPPLHPPLLQARELGGLEAVRGREEE